MPRSSATSRATRRAGYAYSRIVQPDRRALGAAYAELAGGRGRGGPRLGDGRDPCRPRVAAAARATGSSRRAPPTASTRTLLIDTFARFGVRVDFADMTDIDAAAAAIAAAPTRVVYAETIANPTTVVTDHATVAQLAHEHGATYIVDNTFASPYVCRPLDLGADLVVESATKFLGGHSDVIAGVVAGRGELIARSRVQVDTGATIGPFDAFLVLRGILTLGVRAERHARTAAALAAWLERQAGVRRVLYPGLPSHPQHAVAVRQFRAGRRRRDARLRGRRRARGRPGRHRCADPARADRLARQRPHDGRPPAVDLAAPALRGRARRGRDHARACCASRSGSRTSRTCRPTSRRRSPSPAARRAVAAPAAGV